MNWDAVGALAELAGAVGVILSLLYLAAQIRQSSTIARATGFQTLVENLNLSVADLRNPEFAPLFLRGLRSYKELEVEERIQFGQFLNGMAARFATTLEFERSGVVNPSMAQAHAEIMRSIFQAPGVREWWSSTNREFLNQEVRDWIDQHVNDRGDR
jgi:hypothetical protein